MQKKESNFLEGLRLLGWF